MRSNIKRITAFLLGMILIAGSITTFAGNANSDYGESSIGNGSGGSGGSMSSQEAAAAWSERWTGLRVYVVDEYGTLMPSTAGAPVIDFLYRPDEMKDDYLTKDYQKYYQTTKKSYTGTVYTPGASKSFCITRVGGNLARTTQKSVTDMNLGFNPALNNETAIDNYPTLCNYGNGRRTNGRQGVSEHFENATEYGYDVTGDGISDPGLLCLAYQYWPDIANGFYVNGYSLCVEQIFGVKLQKNHKITGEFFYGTPYEWGLYCQKNNFNPENNMSFRTFTNNYISKSIRISHTPNIADDGITCLKNTSGLQKPSDISSKGRLSAAQLVSEGYGIIIYHAEFEIKDEEVEPQPPQEDIKQSGQNDNVQIFDPIIDNTDVEAIDSIDAYFGYRAQEGRYDISTDYGIPVTEYLTNEIYVQDRVIKFTYGAEEWEQINKPTVTYNLTYKVPYQVRHSREEPVYSNGIQIGTKTEYYYTTEYRDETGICGTGTAVRKARYYYITDYAVYGLEQVNVLNIAANAEYYDALTDLLQSDIHFVASGIENPGIITGSDVNEHVDFSNVRNITAGNSDIGHNTFSSRSEAEAWVAANGNNWADDHIGYPVVKNDRVEIQGVIYMDDIKVTGKANTDADRITYTPEPVDPTSDYKITNQTADDLFIYSQVPNGKYYSTFDVRYRKLAATNSHAYYLEFTWTATDSDKSHIIENKTVKDKTMNENITLKNGRIVNYRSQEPIRIVTPIIAPSTLRYDENVNEVTGVQNKVHTSVKDDQNVTEEEKALHGTQLVDESNAQQLRLDETYVITFDPTEHYIYGNAGYYGLANELLLGYGNSAVNNNDSNWFYNNVFSQNAGFESNSKYDKYVKTKQVRFPFDVYIDNKLFAANTWITLYTYDPDTGTSTAGDTSTNHLKDFTFYIPPWARETVLYDGKSEDFIEIRVEAINTGSNADKTHEGWNAADKGADNDTYVATYTINVQVSGWIYDFKIVGSNPATPWTGAESNDDVSTAFASLSSIHDEFFTGIYNRTGNDSIYNSNDSEEKDKLQRYYDDGKVEVIDEIKDTLPLSDGKSEIYEEMGSLVKDSDFTFTISTMSNLNENDRIVIRPTFTWYSSDLTEKLEHDEICLYYHNYEKGQDLYIPYGSERDKNLAGLYMQMDSLELKDTVNKNDIMYLVQKRNLERFEDIVNDTEHEIGYMTELTIKGNELMTYNTDALEELKINQGRDYDNLVDILNKSDGYSNGNIQLSSREDALIQSVQTWYGRYSIPKNLFVVKKSDLTANGVTTLYDYVVKNGSIRDDDKIFQRDGFLVVNFDITVYKGEQKYLTYRYGTSNQWQRQGQQLTAKVSTYQTAEKYVQYLQANKKSTETFKECARRLPISDVMETINLKYGDVAVVDLSSTSHGNKYSRLVFTN